MTQVALIARFKAKDGRGEELIAALRPLAESEVLIGEPLSAKGVPG